MRNIHILPTDKPSRLRYNLSNVLVLTKEPYRDYSKQVNQNIYITSDEEIKEGDYVLSGTNTLCKCMYPKNVVDRDVKKIILTTDADLIADGVQAIDDEFLQWYIKNPSCEWVELGFMSNITPNGSIRQYKIIIPKEESKQETLEEAAENYVRNESDATLKLISKYSFKDGAKWQQERMYSEEDMRLAIKKARNISDGKDCFDAEDISGCTEVCTYGWRFNMSEDSIIEQFKKK